MAGCERCLFRGKYDENPHSILGRLWRWHINWCPGWKAYMNTMDENKRVEVAKTYRLKKYLS